MADKSFSDTSRPVKNPLFSAAVTGFSVDDFTQNAVLMPVIPKPEPEPPKEPTPQPPPPIQPVEIFSEISLDPDSQDITNQFTIHDNSYYSQNLNPLEESSSINRNPSQSPFSPVNPLSSLTNPAAHFTASLSQLPSVASSVFSSFSSILGRTSSVVNPPKPPEVEYKSSLDNLLGGYDNSNQYSAAPVPLIPATQYTSTTPESIARDVDPPPPVPIYSGSSTQIPSSAPPTLGGSNNYRLHRKKTYAQVPGLCRTDAPAAFKPQDQFVPLSQSSSNLPPLPVAPVHVSFDGNSTSNEVNLGSVQPQSQPQFPPFQQFSNTGNSLSNAHLYDNSIPTSIHPSSGNLNEYPSSTVAPELSQSNTPYWSSVPTNLSQADSTNIFNPVSAFEQPTKSDNSSLPSATLPYSNTIPTFATNVAPLQPHNSLPPVTSPHQNQSLAPEQHTLTNLPPPPSSSLHHIKRVSTNSSDLQNNQSSPLPPPPIFSGFSSAPQIQSVPPNPAGPINYYQSPLPPAPTTVSPSPQVQEQSSAFIHSPATSVPLPPPPTGGVSSFRKQDLYKSSPFSNYPKPPQLNTSTPQAAPLFTGLPPKPNLFPAPPPSLASAGLTQNVQIFNPAIFGAAENNTSSIQPISTTENINYSNNPSSFFSQSNNLIQGPNSIANTSSTPSGNLPFNNQTPAVNSGRSSVTSFTSNLHSERNSESPATIIPDTNDLSRNLSAPTITRLITEEAIVQEPSLKAKGQEEVPPAQPEISTKSYFEQHYFPNNQSESTDSKSTENNLLSSFSNNSPDQTSANYYQPPSAADFFNSSYADNHNITDTVTQFAQSTPNFFTQQHSTSPYFPPTNIYSESPTIMASSDMTVPQDFAGIQFTGSNAEMENLVYRPVYQHWFYKKDNDTKAIWEPFSMVDSMALEEACTGAAPDDLVPTDGGRYDVNICTRMRVPVFWTGKPTEVRRCSWFFKTVDSRFIPYEEPVASRLEEEYRLAMETNDWHRRVSLPNGETVVFHGPLVIVHFLQAQSPDAWGNTPQTANRPRVVKRGVDEFDINDGDPKDVDHLLFLVHGIGSVCDLKFRTVEEVVDEFRSSSLQLLQSHYRSACSRGEVNRVEVLPVSWHGKLHSDETGIDKKLKAITLESIPKLRNFTNDTLLDVLFYTSPMFCENIMQTVGSELNRLYALFQKRNPSFKGGVSLGGHSLGSLILFDLLCNQKPAGTTDKHSSTTVVETASQDNEKDKEKEGDTIKPLKRGLSRKISYVIGNAGTGQPFIKYPQLDFYPNSFFALGSPIGMFVTVRGIDSLGLDFALPTCPNFFNIFHPYDPVAYRIEALVNPDTSGLRPVLIPHHKGRKRMHLELKDTMTRVGADLKQRLLDSVRSTWNSVYQMAVFKNQQSLEEEVDKVLEEQLNLETNNRVRLDSSNSASDAENPETDLPLGRLNSGRRIDYVLQEAPLEFFNDYLFALTSHVCYWESEDTMLLILKEIYKSRGVSTDSQIAQPTMTIERPSSETSSRSNSTPPTANITPGFGPSAAPSTTDLVTRPPPTGFARK